MKIRLVKQFRKHVRLTFKIPSIKLIFNCSKTDYKTGSCISITNKLYIEWDVIFNSHI